MNDRQFHIRKYNELDPTQAHEAVEFLRELFGDSPALESFQDTIEKDPDKWWEPFHMFGGMQIRNVLRDNGFGEKELKVENLDDYYIPLVELAVMGDDYYQNAE